MAEVTGGGDTILEGGDDLCAWEMAMSPLCNWTSVTGPDCNQTHLPVTQLQRNRFRKARPQKMMVKKMKLKQLQDLRRTSKYDEELNLLGNKYGIRFQNLSRSEYNKGMKLLREMEAINYSLGCPNPNELLKFPSLQLNKDPNLNSEGEGGFDPELEPDWNDGFDPDLDPNWNSHNVVSWDEHVVEALHLVRLYEITEDDPLHGLPVITRFCKFNIALFDFEKESKAIRGPPILKLSARDHIKLADSINLVSFKILKSDVGYPVSVFGTVLVRDQFDYKCIYVFKRGKDNAQVINSPEDMLTLTDPCRGLAVTNGMFFEINLKIKGSDSGDDIDFSKGVIERDLFICDKELKTRLLDSWHSSVQLAYTPVPCAVAANLAVNVVEWPCDSFIGEVTAWTTGNENQISLYDSEVEGTETSIGDGGSVVLSRCLVAVPVDEELVLRVCAREGGSEALCFELTLSHLEDDVLLVQGAYALRVKIEWTAILSRTEKGVLRHVGHNLLVV